MAAGAPLAQATSIFGAPLTPGAIPSKLWTVGNVAVGVMETRGASGFLTLEYTLSDMTNGWAPLPYSTTLDGATTTGNLAFTDGTRVYFNAPVGALRIGGNVASGALTLWFFGSPFPGGGAGSPTVNVELGDIDAQLDAILQAMQPPQRVEVQVGLEPVGDLNPFPVTGVVDANLLAGEQHLGNVGGIIGNASVEFTRPNDTTAYAAQDVVGPLTTSVLTLQNVARVAGGGGYITAAKLSTNLATFLAGIRIYFWFSTPPAAIADNSPFTLLWANRVGRWYLDLPTLATAGAGSDSASTIDIADRLPFTCASGSRDIYAVVVATTAATPAAFQQFRLAIETELY